MKVPSTNNSELSVWVHSCTDEVQNCRQIAATNTVILKEYQNDETSESSGKRAAKGVTFKAKGDLEQEHQPIHNIIWSIAPCRRDTPDNVHPGFSKKTAFLTRHSEKRESDGAFSWTAHIGFVNRQNPNMIKGLIQHQILGKLTSQRKKDMKFAGSFGSKMEGQLKQNSHYYLLHTTSASSPVTPTGIMSVLSFEILDFPLPLPVSNPFPIGGPSSHVRSMPALLQRGRFR